MFTRRLCVVVGAVVLPLSSVASSCGDASREAQRVQLPVVIDGSASRSVTTDLGYNVTITTFRGCIADLELTTEGEAHVAERSWLQRLLVSSAYAHPGHFAGGEVIGELPGRFIADWAADGETALGDAVLLEGAFTGANLTLATASTADELAADDPLIGHSFELTGTAERDGQMVSFTALITQDEGRQVIGAPFEMAVTATSNEVLSLQLLLQETYAGTTLLDGIDFFSLDDGSGVVVLQPDSPENNRLRRALQAHDYWLVAPHASDPTRSDL